MILERANDMKYLYSLIFLTFAFTASALADEIQTPFTIETEKANDYSKLSFHGNDLWYESNYWSGPDWTRVGRTWMHPGSANDAIRTFLVPQDGKIIVFGTVRKLHLDGDGVIVTILHDDREIWRTELEGKDHIGVDLKLSLTVKQGERLCFVVNRRGEYACDTTGLAPVIIYPATGEIFDAAESFSDKQGTGNWFYEMNGPTGPAPKPTVKLLLTEDEYHRLAEGMQNVPDFDMLPSVLTEWVRDDALGDDFSEAIRDHLDRAARLIETRSGVVDLPNETKILQQLQREAAATGTSNELYLKVRLLKRSILFADPRTQFGEMLFVKNRPPAYTHLVGQYFGWNQRPGGGIYILERPGFSLKHRDLLQDRLPPGHVLEPRLSYDAGKVAFSHVAVPEQRIDWQTVDVNEAGHGDHYYHLYEMGIDGGNLRQLTSDCYDDMMPEYLPDGGLAFVSSRRKAYSRCFGPQFGQRWHSYTLFRIDPDSEGVFDPSRITQLSFNDVNDWFPAMSNTGTLLFARWDYIDRDAVTHQNLWAVRPDGTNPVAVWGNATSKPHCSFQPKAIPNSGKVAFIASAHHSITAGPVCVVDPAVDANSLDAVRRITPGPFPESESLDIPEYYNAPWPLGEDLFLVAYSRDKLIFEPTPNIDNALGLYLLDDQGNRELLYRDTEIGSTCPIPITPRPVPPVVHSAKNEVLAEEGLGEMSIIDVYEGIGDVPRGSLKEIRVVQIFPKTSYVANQPRIGVAGEENARAVLGVVPIEADGSAKFLVPSGKPLLLQVLDEDGFAYQTMRSTTYVMPGEMVSCVGCHEERMSTAATRPASLPAAFQRDASRLQETPESGRPYGFMEMVQPILDSKCVECHSAENPEGGYDLSRRIVDNGYTVSYNAICRDSRMIPRFPERNQIQQTTPGGEIGARGSGLIGLLKQGHEDVNLSPEELRQIGTWIDLNAVFFGAYDEESLQYQRLGKAIPMPVLE